jgi:hypothetical protein
MALFVEVDSVEKECKVIINLDGVSEVAPLSTGGCALFLLHGGILKVKNEYDEFKQFAMQTVTAESIAARFPTKKEKTEKLEIPKL